MTFSFLYSRVVRSNLHLQYSKKNDLSNGILIFALNRVMENFDTFMFKKSLDTIAARCEREQLPIVEFVEWYEEEGQYQENIFGNMAGYGLAGAGLGSWAGLPGAIAGGLGGAAYGLGKGIYDKFKNRSYNVTKQQAVDALMRFAQTSPSNARLINKVADFVARINPEGVEGRQPNSQQRQQTTQQTQKPAMDMSKLSSSPQSAAEPKPYSHHLGMAQGIA